METLQPHSSAVLLQNLSFATLPSAVQNFVLRCVAVVCILGSVVPASAQDLDNLAAGAASDLQKALSELSTLRQQVETERLPLARRLSDLEQKLTERRSEFGKAQRFQENQLVELNALKAEARHRSEEVKYIDSLLGEYARAFRSRLNFIEEPRFSALFDAVDKAADSSDLSAEEKFSHRSTLLSSALKRIEGALGGELFEGKALDKQGRIQQGKVALVGPVAMFASASGGASGLLQQELNKADPTVVSVEKISDEEVRQLVTSGTGELAFDASMGNAFKLSALKESFYQKLAHGGPVMIPLLGLGLSALIVAFFKWFQLSQIQLVSERDLQRVLGHLEQRHLEKALAQARAIPGLAGELLATAVEHYDEKKEYIEEIVYEKMLSARAKLERGIAFLALTATAGPLMGLLGTVMGMIATFKLISSFGSGDPKLLASGISEALIATATGMTVAIPALLLHAFLSRKAKGIIGSMEQTAVGFINGVPGNEKHTFA